MVQFFHPPTPLQMHLVNDYLFLTSPGSAFSLYVDRAYMVYSVQD